MIEAHVCCENSPGLHSLIKITGKSAQDYVNAIALRVIAWIRRYAVPRAFDDPLVASEAQNSPEAHLTLLDRFSKVAPYLLPGDTELLSSNLWHGDLHSGNVFIEQNRITAIMIGRVLGPSHFWCRLECHSLLSTMAT